MSEGAYHAEEAQGDDKHGVAVPHEPLREQNCRDARSEERAPLAEGCCEHSEGGLWGPVRSRETQPWRFELDEAQPAQAPIE